MKLVKTEDAVGCVLCHDLTQIIKGVTKDALFRKGHVVREEDIPALLSIGKEHLYVWEADDSMLHENDAARILCALCKSDGMRESDIKEGRIELSATCNGLFKVDGARLQLVNSFGQMMIATRHGNTPVRRGDKLAGMRIIPLVIEKEKMQRIQELCGGEPLLRLLPYKLKRAAVIATGNEVFSGRIQDTFTPEIAAKLAEYGVEVTHSEILGDDPAAVTDAIKRAVDEKGAELVCCTGGMSVDPDDRTPLAIKNTGARIVSYGAPVLPGAMFMLAYYGQRQTPVMGLPGCVMYSQRTIFDLALPRVLACDPITAGELASLGEGGLCLNCKVCVYPACGFGKGW